MAIYLLQLVSLASALTVLAAQNNHDQCLVYYGGMVFPEETRRTVEHGMHWSKTQSMRGLWVGGRYQFTVVSVLQSLNLHLIGMEQPWLMENSRT